MCCIFTFCGWFFELIMRCWTFAMSSIVFSAVCCLLLIGSAAGIALGYNYSLSEYMDLRETNVSVYIKRGVFDDEIADEFDWRRSGNIPLEGNDGGEGSNMITSGYEEKVEVRPGRRLENSIFESDDHQRFEGSLMKLTGQPLHNFPTRAQNTDEQNLSDMTATGKLSLDQIKSLQAILNLRRANLVSKANGGIVEVSRSSPPQQQMYPTDENGNPLPIDMGMFAMPNRRMDPNNIRGNSHRYAVPIGNNADRLDRWKWINPRLRPEDQVTVEPEYPVNLLNEPVVFPSPVTPRVALIGPTRQPPPKTPLTVTNTSPSESNPQKIEIPDYNTIPADYNAFTTLSDYNLEEIKKSIDLHPDLKSDDFLKNMERKPDEEDEEEEAGSAPIR